MEQAARIKFVIERTPIHCIALLFLRNSSHSVIHRKENTPFGILYGLDSAIEYHMPQGRLEISGERDNPGRNRWNKIP
jgi:hypothetical protein